MRRLGELEAVVMERLWAWDRPTLVREVVEDLHADRRLAYTTVMTVMDNLFRKGLLRRELSGRAYLYTPAKTREEYLGDLLEDVLSGSSDRTVALLGFVERLSADEIAKLRSALDRG